MHTHTNELTSFFFNVLLPHPKGQPVTFSKHISSSWCWDEKRNKKIMHQCKQKKQSWNLWFGSGHTHKSFINVNMTIILNLWSGSGHTHTHTHTHTYTQKKSFINVNMTIMEPLFWFRTHCKHDNHFEPLIWFRTHTHTYTEKIIHQCKHDNHGTSVLVQDTHTNHSSM